MQGHYVRGSWGRGGGDRCPVYFIPDVKIFFFAGCNAEKLMHFCPPVCPSLVGCFEWHKWRKILFGRDDVYLEKQASSCKHHSAGLMSAGPWEW